VFILQIKPSRRQCPGNMKQDFTTCEFQLSIKAVADFPLPSSLVSPRFFPLFRSLYVSLALHYLNAWNRLMKKLPCMHIKQYRMHEALQFERLIQRVSQCVISLALHYLMLFYSVHENPTILVAKFHTVTLLVNRDARQYMLERSQNFANNLP